MDQQNFGLSVDARGLIQQLKNNLVDRYPRDSIFKELLQNADDAKATRLDLGWSPGLGESAPHPLLRGPAVFAVNDGPFKPEDGEAIRSFGLNYKAADRSTIGKFGLGLKSVFHLCEAFFFAASADKVGGIVNPWWGTGFHEDWNHFGDAERAAVVEHLRTLLEPGDTWFALWLPLRRADHCAIAPDPDAVPADEPTTVELALHADHPGDLGECPPDMADGQAAQFADYLPLLRHLRRVRFWGRWAGSEGKRPAFDVRLPDDSPRCRFPDRPPSDSAPGTGEVSAAGAATMPFALVEAWVDELESFRRRSGWPTSMSFESLRPRPDKAQPHAAVMLSRWPVGGTGRLKLGRAVFLPLQGDSEAVPLSVPVEYSLTLHACFFVDAGRGRPTGADSIRPDASREDRLRAEWNNQLLREGVCPLVLPTLDALVRRVRPADAEIRALTQAFCDSGFAGANAAALTRDHQWLYRWHPHEPEWQLLGGDVAFLEIPDFGPTGPALASEVLPGLAALVATAAFAPRGLPRVVRGNPQPWSDAQMATALTGTPAHWDGPRWAYLRRFLDESSPGESIPATAGALAGMLRRAFATTPVHNLRGHRPVIQAIVQHVPPRGRLALPELFALTEGERRDALEYPLDVLVLPDDFDPPEARSAARLAASQAADLLAFLQPACLRHETTRLAASVVAAADDRDALLANPAFAGLALWVADGRRAADAERREVLSYAALDAERAGGRLFRATADDGRIAPALGDALDGAAVYRIEGRTADLLFGEGAVPALTPRSIFGLLVHRPQLADDPTRRAGLLRALLAGDRHPVDVERRRAGIRYLLHGSCDHFDSTVSLLAGDARAGGVWARLARAHLDQSDGGWRVVPESLAGLLHPEVSQDLGVHGLDPDGVAELIGVAGAERLDIDLNDRERDQVLRDWHDRADLLRSLPLHDGVHGGRHRIGPNCFWQRRYSLDGALAGRVTLLRLSKDQVLEQIQLRIAPELRPDDIIALALDAGPANYWREILSALAAAGSLARDVRERLAAAEWVPTGGRGPVAPASVVIDVDGRLDQEIGHALAAVPEAGVFGTAQLDESVRSLDDLGALRRLCSPSRPDLLGRVAAAVRQAERFRTGVRLDDEDAIEDWLTAFAGAAPQLAAARGLVAAAWATDRAACRERLLAGIMPGPRETDLTAERACVLLLYLSERADRASGVERQAVRRIHSRYLDAAADLADWRSAVLPHVRLLSANGRWRPAAELCVGSGLAPESTLDAGQGKLLDDRVSRQRQQAVAASPGDSRDVLRGRVDAAWRVTAPRRLREYFEPWKYREEYAAWAGALLAILGDLDEVVRLAREFLPQGQSADAVRAAARLHERQRTDPNGRAHTDTPAGMMERQRFLVEVTPARETVRVVNLLGREVGVAPAVSSDDLFIGYAIDPVDCYLEGNLQVHSLNLRPVDVRSEAPKTVLRWVEQTAARVLEEVYGQRGSAFAEALPGLTERDHEVRTAQTVALDARHTLRQLGHLQCIALRDVLAEFDAAADRRAEEQVASERGQDLEGIPSEDLEQDARNALRGLVVTSAEVRADLLSAVRRKLGEYRYRPEGIIFELFQNADDAAVELADSAQGVFAVEAAANWLTVMHQGRQINKPSASVGREQAARDLRKILALGHSDKGGEGGPPLTGRFGLGFKSVFLVSDRPQLLSGQLAVEVLGGLYPYTLDKAATDALRDSLRRAGLNDTSGTATQIHIRPGIERAVVDQRYRRLAAFLCVFARKVRRCAFVTDASAHEAHWDTDDDGAAATGRLTPLPDGSGVTPRRALVLRGTDNSAMLFGLDAHGVSPLDNSIPTVWAVAPTEEFFETGYAVNGPFLLDVGRSQVDWNADGNRHLFERLGREFGAALVALCDEDWGHLRARADLASDDCYEFWRSVWDRLSAGAAVPDSLKCMVWDEKCGCAARLYRERKALPTGVPLDGYRVLTSIGDVSAVLVGELDAGDTATLRAVAHWPSFQSLAPGRLASGRLWLQLRRHSAWLPDVAQIDLAQLVRRELESSPNVDAGRAATFGQVVTRERDDLREILQPAARFRSRVGRWEVAGNLLLSRSNDADHRDETMIAAFAPAECVLAPEYAGAAVEFFLACRDHKVARIDEMVDWAVRAEGEEQRCAVRRYMAEGEQAFRFNSILRPRVPGTWLASMTDAEIDDIAGTREFTADILRAAIGRLPFTGPPPAPPAAVRPPVPRDVWRRMEEWWDRDAAQWLAWHDREGVPGGDVVRTIHASRDDADPETRLAWLKLFVGSILTTIGRATSAQHQGFIDLCENRGWFRTLLDRGSAGWLREVESYMDEGTEYVLYFHWLSRFLSVAQTARHLDSFAASFRAIDAMTGPWTLRDVLAVRVSPQFRGTGHDAPTLVPLLGVGACVVVRELRRAGVIRSRQADRYCYPPLRRVRELLQRLCWDGGTASDERSWELSASIHGFLADHLADPTFGGAFDVPLRAIARHESLRVQLLGS